MVESIKFLFISRRDPLLKSQYYRTKQWPYETSRISLTNDHSVQRTNNGDSSKHRNGARSLVPETALVHHNGELYGQSKVENIRSVKREATRERERERESVYLINVVTR